MEHKQAADKVVIYTCTGSDTEQYLLNYCSPESSWRGLFFSGDTKVKIPLIWLCNTLSFSSSCRSLSLSSSSGRSLSLGSSCCLNTLHQMWYVSFTQECDTRDEYGFECNASQVALIFWSVVMPSVNLSLNYRHQTYQENSQVVRTKRIHSQVLGGDIYT